jgi:glycosyltransferase 2 family protein
VSSVFGALAHGADALSDPFSRLDARFAVAALVFQAANLLFRATAWRNVLVAAYPDRRVSLLGVSAAYVAGVALNGFLPARAGEVAKITLARLQVRGSSVVAIAAAGSVVLAFDGLLGAFLIALAWLTGALPAAPHLPAVLSVVRQQPLLGAGTAVTLGGLGWVVWRRLRSPLRRMISEIRRGAAIWASPRRYLRTVVLLQLGAWFTRIAVAYSLLAAFGLPASFRLALLVVVLGGLSALVPATPGGMGTQQLLLIYALHGTVAAATAVSFSIGMQITVTVTNTAAGIVAAMIVFRTLKPLAALTSVARAGAH